MHPFAQRFHEIMTDTDLTAVDKMVVAVLWFHCGNNSHCWPSITTLAAEVGADRKTIIQSLSRLTKKERIEIVKTTGHPNRYRLLTSPKSGTTTNTISGTTTSPKNGTGTSPNSGTGLPKNQSQNRDYYPKTTSPKSGTRKEEEKNKNKNKNTLPSVEASTPKEPSDSSKIYNHYIELRRKALEEPAWVPESGLAKVMRANLRDFLKRFSVPNLKTLLDNFFQDEYAAKGRFSWPIFARDPVSYKPRGDPLPHQTNKPSARDVVAQVLKERKENGNR